MNAATIEKAELWQQRITDFQSSGLSAIDWCEHQGLNIHTFRYWIKRANDKPFESNNSHFTQLIPKVNTTPQISGVSLRIGGYLIDVSNDFDELTLLRLLGMLKKC